jgi:hypothetical protein
LQAWVNGGKQHEARGSGQPTVMPAVNIQQLQMACMLHCQTHAALSLTSMARSPCATIIQQSPRWHEATAEEQNKPNMPPC